ncbi:MAG: nucleoside 2-deoxyribosyltransferase [Eubacterium sp.]|nr:nucleoside 2-deoxyribosyltransferase [Eubacterium sp.]
MKKCFVVTPIGNEGTETRKRTDQVFKYIIEPVCQDCEFEVVRVDKINQADSITQTIIDSLNSSELVIADMTEHNANAFYEMGYRTCTGKPMIHIKSKETNIPFDIAGIRAFDYDLTDLDSVSDIKSRLKATVESFDFSENDDMQEDSNFSIRQSNKDTNIRLLQILYEIQDQINELSDEIRNKDTETIQAIVKATQPQPAEDPNVAIVKALLPELIRNPGAMQMLMELSDKAQKDK